MSETAESQSKRGARFSLLALLLLTTIVGLGTTLTLLYSSRQELRREMKLLRESRGQLYIEDETRLHAIGIESPGSRQWRFRVYVPSGQRYGVFVHNDAIPKVGVSAGQEVVEILEPGEHVVAYQVIQDSGGGDPFGALTIDGVSSSSGRHPWAAWVDWRGTTAEVGTTTEKFDGSEPAVLLRHRVSAVAKKASAIEDPSAGLMIWMEPQ